MKTLLILVGAALVLFGQAAGAQQGSLGGYLVCRPDIQKFCQNVPSGENRIIDCLNGHYDELRSACQSLLKKPANAPTPTSAPDASGTAAACKTDVSSFCKGVAPGGGRIIDCLVDHQKDISDGCYAVLKKRQDAQDAAAPKPQQ
jgi:hypothetical protein